MSETLRAPSVEDARHVAELLSESWPEPIDEASVLRDWGFPGVQVENDVRLGRESYAFVENFSAERVWIGLGGRPTAELLDWAELRAHEMGTRLISGAWATQEPLLHELERRGFARVRVSHRMTIDLIEPTPGPVWPDGIGTRTFEPGDERVFYELHQETFKDSWEPIEETYDEWAYQFLGPDALAPSLWALAVAGDEPAAFAMCHPHAVDAGLGWVRVFGVRRPFRGRGIGRALLLHTFAEFRALGMTRAGLGVDSTSPTGAHKLYKSVGMRVCARFAIHEKGVA
ncbi:MAG: GNAT family N-acetyltransferase [Gaiellaceae bacterium]